MYLVKHDVLNRTKTSYNNVVQIDSVSIDETDRVKQI